MRVVILFTILILSIFTYGQSRTHVIQNNNSSILSSYDEFHLNGVQIDRYIKLKWSAKNIGTDDYFIIEKSVNGIQWLFVDCVESFGEYGEIVDYEYHDYDILRYLSDSVIYYRIVQTNFYGEFLEHDPIPVKFSPSVSYVLNQNSKVVSLYTNDYIGSLLCVFNVYGERIYSEIINDMITIIDFSGYSGVHIIRINGIYVDNIIL